MSAHSAVARVLDQHKGEHLLVALQDFPDWDDIASLAVHQRISEQRSIRTTVMCAGEMSKERGRRLSDLLGNEILHARALPNHAHFDGVIFLGATKNIAKRLLDQLRASAIPTVMTIASESEPATLEAEAFILKEGRSTSSIYARVLQQDLPRSEISSIRYRQLATALILGIASATADLERAGQADFRAVSQLADQFDPDLAHDVISPKLSAATLEVLRRALTTRASLHGFSTAGVGYLSSIDVDALSFTAQFLLKEQQIHTALVFAIVRDDKSEERLFGTLATNGHMLDSQTLLNVAFEDLEIEHLTSETLESLSFQFSLGQSSRSLPEENQMIKWAYYEIMVLERIAKAILQLYPEPGSQKSPFAGTANDQ